MKEFPGLTPSDIRKFYISEIECLINEINNYRELVRSQEISIDQIRSVIFEYLKVKEIPKDKIDEHNKKAIEKAPLSSVQLTEKERIAWRKSGYKPLDSWLKKFRNNQ